MTPLELRNRIETKTAEIGVVGVGYVGLAAAAVIAGTGFNVKCLDVNSGRIDMISEGRVPFAGDEPGLAELLSEVVAAGRVVGSTEPSCMAGCDAVLICVDTPIGADHRARWESLEAACARLGPVLKEGALVVVESTTAPGTVDGLVKPALEAATGGREGSRFHLGHCPERVMPGKLLRNMRTMDRVLGSYSPEGAAAMEALYGSFVGGKLDHADPLTAELVKTAENAYRDVSIAFANELALICERVGGDVWQVRRLVNQVPGRNVLLPGSGVGGHCIPKDPWLLASALGDEAEGSLLASARRVNDRMPAHCAQMVIDLLAENGVKVDESRVVVFGYSYLEESDDTRNSPSAALIPLLEGIGCKVRIHDPFVERYARDPLDAARGADCVVVMVAHKAYRELDLNRLATAMHRPLIVDTRAVFEPEDLAASPFEYRRLGTGRVPTAAN